MHDKQIWSMNYANEFEGETKISQSLTKRETGNIDFRNIKKFDLATRDNQV